jgi:serine/threonine protein phosphatase PrpC
MPAVQVPVVALGKTSLPYQHLKQIPSLLLTPRNIGTSCRYMYGCINSERRCFPITVRRMKRRIQQQQQQYRFYAAWWRMGNTKVGPAAGAATGTNNNNNGIPRLHAQPVPSNYPTSIVNDEYTVSVCSIQGYRDHMEDDFMIHTSAPQSSSSIVQDNTYASTSNATEGNVTSTSTITNTKSSNASPDGIVACFDGHGGRAVSRYLRQNLYTNLLAALNMIQQTRPALPFLINTVDDYDNADHPHDNDERSMMTTTTAPYNEDNVQDRLDLTLENPKPINVIDFCPTTAPTNTGTTNSTERTESISSCDMLSSPSPPLAVPNSSVDDYVSALEVALDKVDREVLKIHHWRRQGSTAITCWIHTASSTTATDTSTSTATANDTADAAVSPQPNESIHTTTEYDALLSPPPPPTRTIITANIGDSRAVLCRNGHTIPLSRDHKPDDPIEQQRIQQLGGRIVWDGKVDRFLEPIHDLGCYRVNGRLSLSRSIGDRLDRPVVNSDPDITLITIVPEVRISFSETTTDIEHFDEFHFCLLILLVIRHSLSIHSLSATFYY